MPITGPFPLASPQGGMDSAIAALSPYLSWRLEDAVSSTTILDSSGGGHTGTVTDAPIFQSPTLFTDARAHSAQIETTGLVNCGASVADGSWARPSGSFNIGFWRKQSAVVSPDRAPFGKMNTGLSEGWVAWNPSNVSTMAFGIVTSGGFFAFDFVGNINDGLPHLFIVTYDSTDGSVKMYQDDPTNTNVTGAANAGGVVWGTNDTFLGCAFGIWANMGRDYGSFIQRAWCASGLPTQAQRQAIWAMR